MSDKRKKSFKCPKCNLTVVWKGTVYRCAQGHEFNEAKKYIKPELDKTPYRPYNQT